jgi:hypothetical protein
MITENKITEISCIADEFCKVFDAQMARYTFKAIKKVKIIVIAGCQRRKS